MKENGCLVRNRVESMNHELGGLWCGTDGITFLSQFAGEIELLRINSYNTHVEMVTCSLIKLNP